MSKPSRKPAAGPQVTFERILKAFRAEAKGARRRAWDPASLLIRVGDDLFITHPSLGRNPQVWKPYPEDFLAKDWSVVR